MKPTDILGRPLSADEAELVEIVGRLLALGEREGLPPCLVANLRFATAALSQAVQDLGLDWGHPDVQGL